MPRDFYRMNHSRILGGVCSGLAYAVGWPTWSLRLLLILFLLLWGVGVVPYLLLWLFVPKWPVDPVDYTTVAKDP